MDSLFKVISTSFLTGAPPPIPLNWSEFFSANPVTLFHRVFLVEFSFFSPPKRTPLSFFSVSFIPLLFDSPAHIAVKLSRTLPLPLALPLTFHISCVRGFQPPPSLVPRTFFETIFHLWFARPGKLPTGPVPRFPLCLILFLLSVSPRRAYPGHGHVFQRWAWHRPPSLPSDPRPPSPSHTACGFTMAPPPKVHDTSSYLTGLIPGPTGNSLCPPHDPQLTTSLPR